MTSLCFTIAYMVGKGAHNLYLDAKHKREEKKKKKQKASAEREGQIDDEGCWPIDDANVSQCRTGQNVQASKPQANLGLSPESRACISARHERAFSRQCSMHSHFASMDAAVQHIRTTEYGSEQHYLDPSRTAFERFLLRSQADTLVEGARSNSAHRDPPPQYEGAHPPAESSRSTRSYHLHHSPSDPQLPPYEQRDAAREQCEPERERRARRTASFSNSLRGISPVTSFPSISSIIKPKPLLSACNRRKGRSGPRERLRAARRASYLSLHEGDPESIEAVFGCATVSENTGLGRRNAIRRGKSHEHGNLPPSYSAAACHSYM